MVEPEAHAATVRAAGLPALPESARQARRLVADTCRQAGVDPGVTDDAVLLTSEVVTNAILHARSDVGVTIRVAAGTVRVEVRDHSPHLPARRTYTATATTGRGLELLTSLADDFGSLRTDGGKVVWFVVSRAGPADRPPHDELDEPVVLPQQGDVEVRLRNLPVRLYAAWQQHADALLREYALRVIDEHDDATMRRYGAAAEALAVLARASGPVFADRDAGNIDLAVPVPPESLASFGLLRDVLADASGLAAQQLLLAPASQPEIVAVREWACGEVLRQGGGHDGEPWRGAGSVLDASVGSPVEMDVSDLASAADAVVAADDTNRIIAVSPAVRELLGWTADELVGRRIVALIPERFREAHIAGFTQQLLTGEAHILDAPVRVSALCADGTEREITLTIHRREVASSRSVFVARLSAG